MLKSQREVFAPLRLCVRSIKKNTGVGLILGNQPAQYKPAYGEIESHVVFDEVHARYAPLEIGWDKKKYIHHCIIQVELINDKIWIQFDGTEEGIATYLLEAGVPNNDIVFGFHQVKMRQETEFAENEC